jgi:hypothetical protein
MNMIATTCAGLIVSALLGQTPPPAPQPQAQKPDTKRVTPEVQAKPRTELLNVTTIGCLKAWQPAPADATRMPEPKVGTYVLTPLHSDPSRASDLPTYVLVGGSTVNFTAHVNHKVEISGVEAVAQLPPTQQESAAAPPVRPENKPDARTMPSLTVQSLKMISTACP